MTPLTVRQTSASSFLLLFFVGVLVAMGPGVQ